MPGREVYDDFAAFVKGVVENQDLLTDILRAVLAQSGREWRERID